MGSTPGVGVGLRWIKAAPRALQTVQCLFVVMIRETFSICDAVFGCWCKLHDNIPELKAGDGCYSNARACMEARTTTTW